MDYRIDLPARTIRFLVGHRPIRAGEELCIYYGPDDRLPFPPRAAFNEVTGARHEATCDGSNDDDDEDEAGEDWLRRIGASDSEGSDEASGRGS